MKPTLQTSMARICQHHADRELVILTAWRAAETRDRDYAALRKLERQVKDAGHAFMVLDGVRLDADGRPVAVHQPSLLVLPLGPHPTATEGRPPLWIQARTWARAPGADARHRQRHLFYADGKGRAAVLEATTEAPPELQPLTPDLLTRFYAQLQTDGSFADAWIGLKYIDPPSNWIEGMGRESQGERFDCCESIADFLAALEHAEAPS